MTGEIGSPEWVKAGRASGELRPKDRAIAAKIDDLNAHVPGWHLMRHDNGNPKFNQDGMLLNDDGTRSIFDDVDE